MLAPQGKAILLFLSTLSLRRATAGVHVQRLAAHISIHALLAESDAFCQPLLASVMQFLSTLSLRRATRLGRRVVPFQADFYPRSPCGERRAPTMLDAAQLNISIHALLAESDTPRVLRHCTTYLFLSTLSLRRATIMGTAPSATLLIFLSTLSLRRATPPGFHIFRWSKDFYPRSPCGERRL